MTFPKVAQRLVDFVLHDQRFKQLKVRGGAVVAFREVCSREPLKAEVDQVVEDFWQVWHERFDNPAEAKERQTGGGREIVYKSEYRAG
jgi:hypothetical protein